MIGLGIILALVIGIGAAVYASHRSSSSGYSCVAAPDEECPSDVMVKDWQAYKTIIDRYKMSREDELKANGLMVEMQKEAQKYPGTNWDEKRLRFVKAKVAAPPQPSPAAPTEKK